MTLNNGVGDDSRAILKPEAPSLVCLNKDTGEVYWKDNSPGKNILCSQFASPSMAELAGSMQVVVPQSDGWIRSFEAESGEKLWEFDVNPKESIYVHGGPGDRNDLFANAVVCEDRVYVASGRGAEDGEGPGRLVCIDPTKRGDISSELAVDAEKKPLPRRRLQAVDPQAREQAVANPNSGLVWEFVRDGEDEFLDRMHRSVASVAIAKGLLIAADSAGLVHCLDAKTGKRYWKYDMLAFIWGSPLIVEDKVFVTDEDGDVAIFQLGADSRNSQPIEIIAHDARFCGSPAYADGTMYLATQNSLMAVDAAKARNWRDGLGIWPQWRGAKRDNVASDTGLAGSWEKPGPPQRWSVTGLGNGISPPSVAGGRLIVLSQYDTTEYVRALDCQTGQHLWASRLGESPPQPWAMRWLTQRPSTIDGELLYAVTVLGDLVCLRAADGNELWRKKYGTDFTGERGNFGYSDCPVVCGDKLICTPGGTAASVVALDKYSGELIWKCAVPEGGKAAYGNGLVTEIGDRKQFVGLLEKALVGIAVNDGTLLWRKDGAVDMYTHPHTPLVRDNEILCLNGFGSGLKLLEITARAEAFIASEVYTEPKRRIAQYQDDTIRLKDRVYECSNGIFSCFDWKSGGILWEKRLANATAATYADGHFYVHDLRGTVAMMDADDDGPTVKSQFTLPPHADPHTTATPIIAGGHLYLREDDQLFCYDVRDDAWQPAAATEPLALPAVGRAESGDTRGEKPTGGTDRTPNAIFVPTPLDVVEPMLAAAKVGKDDVVYDLGSGDGRVLIAAAKKYGCRAVGLELDRELVALSQRQVTEAAQDKLVTIKEADFFEADFSEATVVTVYLYPGLLKRLLPKLEKLKPGTRIVSHQFEIPDFPADTKHIIDSQDTSAKHIINVWTTPLKK